MVMKAPISSMIFLKPWWKLQDIKETFATFAEEFTRFMASADQDTKNVIKNIQYCHECSEKQRQQGFKTR